ncbi:hypothetical protein BDN71DRAFT_531003 [Pleurotus eryngii]|uniref:Uncharacterized protein n=1 Tax=Pleurotus eryngii TaxID=5323 RepID=A0A9P6A0U4_PLEER|nr:hypothetical protein BDN71DRAFT_531003 [Pleurotus eryngii]
MNNGVLLPSTPNNPMTAPSPSMLSMNGGGAAISMDIFSTDFVNSVTTVTAEDYHRAPERRSKGVRGLVDLPTSERDACFSYFPSPVRRIYQSAQDGFLRCTFQS